MTRSCGSCTLCCKLMPVLLDDGEDKPAGEWCKHCTKGVGCNIYPRRPEECRGWRCQWLAEEWFGDHWYPAQARMVLSGENEDEVGPTRLVVIADAGYLGRWREEPWHGDLLFASLTVTVLVFAQGRKWVISRGRVIEPDRWIFGQTARGWRVIECENADEMQRKFDAGVTMALVGGQVKEASNG